MGSRRLNLLYHRLINSKWRENDPGMRKIGLTGPRFGYAGCPSSVGVHIICHKLPSYRTNGEVVSSLRRSPEARLLNIIAESVLLLTSSKSETLCQSLPGVDLSLGADS